MSGDPATIARCARACCWYCAQPNKWRPAMADADASGYYHVPLRPPTTDAIWCEATLIWQEFETELQPPPELAQAGG